MLKIFFLFLGSICLISCASHYKKEDYTPLNSVPDSVNVEKSNKRLLDLESIKCSREQLKNQGYECKGEDYVPLSKAPHPIDIDTRTKIERLQYVDDMKHSRRLTNPAPSPL